MAVLPGNFVVVTVLEEVLAASAWAGRHNHGDFDNSGFLISSLEIAEAYSHQSTRHYGEGYAE